MEIICCTKNTEGKKLEEFLSDETTYFDDIPDGKYCLVTQIVPGIVARYEAVDDWKAAAKKGYRYMRAASGSRMENPSKKAYLLERLFSSHNDNIKGVTTCILAAVDDYPRINYGTKKQVAEAFNIH